MSLPASYKKIMEMREKDVAAKQKTGGARLAAAVKKAKAAGFQMEVRKRKVFTIPYDVWMSVINALEAGGYG